MLFLETQMLRVAELFSDASVFEMPPFQRPYRWDDDTAAQLYDDISSAMDRGRPERAGRKNRQDYFLGPMIVTRDRASGVYQVIDGQQRLSRSPSCSPFCEMRFRADTKFKDELQPLLVRPEHQIRRLPAGPRVRLRQADQDAFAAWVQSPGVTKALPDDDQESESRSCILNAIHRIATDIDNPQPAYIKELASFVLNNCYVIQIVAGDLDDGYVLFRSLNSRGQPLNELDLERSCWVPPRRRRTSTSRNWPRAGARPSKSSKATNSRSTSSRC